MGDLLLKEVQEKLCRFIQLSGWVLGILPLRLMAAKMGLHMKYRAKILASAKQMGEPPVICQLVRLYVAFSSWIRYIHGYNV